jgi:hypothetical protein
VFVVFDSGGLVADSALLGGGLLVRDTHAVPAASLRHTDAVPHSRLHTTHHTTCAQVVNSSGVLDCTFHPTQPWLFTAGADSRVVLWCN